ncbi:MAG: CAP domain-containing protein [Patescibacteria group bacterium]|jgi:hypothetical protein
MLNLNHPSFAVEEQNHMAFANKAKLPLLFFGVALGLLLMFLFIPLSHSQDNVDLDIKELILLTNKQRVLQGLPELSINISLNKAAKQKAGNIFKWQKFSHDLPNEKFSAPVKAVGYEYSITGENLAEGFANSEAIIKAWMASAGHRNNILNPKYKEIGMAIKRDKLDGKTTYVVVQYFGAQATLPLVLSENFFPYQLIVPGKIERSVVIVLT